MEIFKTVYQIKDGIRQLERCFDLNRKILIVTDDGVPTEYVEDVIKQCKKPVLYVAKQGEESKSFSTLQEVLGCMLEHNFTRKDAVIALGGGVVGDLSGMAAGIFMRGIDWYNIPTTMLAQIDSSIGGKTAINMSGIKNIVGVFHQPKGIMVDTNLLKTLPKRQMENGLVEALKMGFIRDEALMKCLKEQGYEAHLDEIVSRCIELKSQIVEADEKEQGLRRILNYGHTIGHGFESAFMGKLLHGEAVACGMLAVSEGEVKAHLVRALENLGVMERLQTILVSCTEDMRQKVKDAILHDKKGDEDGCHVILVKNPGSYEIKKVTMEDLFEKVDGFSL